MEIALSVVSKLIIGLIGLIIVIRITGKKNLTQISPYDLVYTLVLGGIIEEAIYDDQVSVLHLILGLALWAFLIWLIEKLANNNERLNKKMKGEPDVLVYDGHLNFDNQSTELKPVEFEQLRALLRTSDCYSLKNAKNVFLETGGQFNVIKFDEDDKDFAVMVIDDGVIEHRVLESHNLTIN